MEISSFPFSEDYYYYNNNFNYNNSFLLQDSNPTTTTTTTANTISFSSPAAKRPKLDNSNSLQVQDSSVQDFVTKLLSFDDNHNNNSPSFFADPTMFNNQPKQETQYNFHNNSPPPVHSVISSNNKRARSDVNDVATTTTSDESNGNGIGAQRRLWVKNRSNAWWEQVSGPDYPEEEFKKAFRMSRATFDMICEELESVVTKKDTMLRLAIPVRQRVAVCIWRLATGEALREVSKRFGLGISTCHKLVLEVCAAIRSVLMPKFLQWPNESRMGEIKREFEQFSGIPNVGGTIYTTHVPIIAPKVSVAAYFNKRHTERNQKTSYSITVQGVVDTRGVFTDICIGWPGSMSDDQILEKSALFQRASRGALKDVCVVGNSGYPLTDWILVPYTHPHLTWTQHAYNEKVEEVQGVSKEAFMRLKARWSCLQKRTEMKLQDLPVVLGACCVLHNICEMNNEGLSPELRFELFDDEMIPENSVRSVNAVRTRDEIAHKLLHHHQAGTSLR